MPQIAIMIQVIVFFIEILKAATDAYARKPTANGGINLKISVCNDFLSMYSNKNEKAPIRNEAGRIQIIKVIIASGMPPLLYPIKVTVCVEEAPGNKLQKALYSKSSCSVTYGLCFTKIFIIMATCAWGPPNAVMLYRKTFFKKGICRSIIAV